MPNRVLRDWTDSDKMDTLSFQAEVLFVRLMMKADDFGSFHAREKMINAACFPLKTIRETDITRWLHELASAGLIAFYDADSKSYLRILNFGQRLRTMKKGFPQPDSDLTATCQRIDSELSATCGGLRPETKRSRNEVETEEETKDLAADAVYDKIVIDTKDLPVLDQWVPVRDFVKDHKPKFFEPYLHLWNIFAVANKIKKQDQLPTDKRKEKFRVRIKEPTFDFLSILAKIKDSKFAKGDNDRKWTVDIDFILESQTNYSKILEGKYDDKD